MFDSYQCVKDLTKRTLMLDKFNQTFGRVAEHVSDLAQFLKEKEQQQREQIETLKRQNKYLLEENTQLQSRSLVRSRSPRK